MQKGGKGDREGELCRRDGVRLVVHHTDSAFPLSCRRKKKSGQKGGRARRKEGRRERGRSRRRVEDSLCTYAWEAQGWEAQAHSFSARSGTRSAPAEKERERVGGSPRGNRKARTGIHRAENGVYFCSELLVRPGWRMHSVREKNSRDNKAKGDAATLTTGTGLGGNMTELREV